MKKILVLLMALIMSVSIFSSCKKSGDEKADKEIIKETVAEYTERMVSGDSSATGLVSEASDYIGEADKKVAAHDSIYLVFENMNSVPEECLKEAEEIRVDAVEKYMDLFSYEQKDIEVKGDKATAKIVLTTPDVEKKDSFRRIADEESKKAFTKEEIEKIVKAQGTGKVPADLFIKAEKLWFKEFVDAFKESVHKEKITYKLEKIEEVWYIVGEK